MPKSRQKSNQHAKWGNPAAVRRQRRQKGPRVATPVRIIGKQTVADAGVFARHYFSLLRQANPRLSQLELQTLFLIQLGIIKKK
jgi:hypothetical protein